MMITAPEPDPHASDSTALLGVVAGGDRSAPGRGELRRLGAPGDDLHVIPEAAASSSERLAGPGGASALARRLRLAPAVQLELVSGREGAGPEVVWASLPEQSREAVLVLLARLIGAGAVEEREEIEERDAL
jgi:hypothetical protein